MARIAYHPGPTVSASPFRRWVPSVGLWAFGVGTAAVFVLSVTPKVKNTFLVKVPVLGSYFEDKTPAEDKPF